MGNANFDPISFNQSIQSSQASHGTAFVHNANVSSGRASGIHSSLDPKLRNKAGKFIRESRDSAAHPNSKAVWINFDTTGSMVTLPQLFIKQLPRVMELLVKDGWLPNPHVLFSTNCDHDDPYPLHLGQFEGGNALSDTLTNILLLGGGGGSPYGHEAYNLVLYMAAFHTEMDCLTLRGEKGYLFFIGDERPNDDLTADQINAVFNCGEERNFTFAELFEAAKEKFHIHWIMPQGAHHYPVGSKTATPHIDNFLAKAFGEHYHRQEADGSGVFPDVAELITGIIALHEGVAMQTIATTTKSTSASRALTKFDATGTLVVKTSGASSTALAAASAPAAKRL